MNENCVESGREERVTERVIFAAQDVAPVGGLTHTFYRYPARFSPVFVLGASGRSWGGGFSNDLSFDFDGSAT